MRKLLLVALLLFAPLAKATTAAVCSTVPAAGKTQMSCAGAFDATASQAVTGTWSFLDANFSILDSAAPTKIFKLEAGSITAGQTRTWTVPDRSDTFAGLGGQTFTGAQAFSGFLSFSGSGAWALDLFKIRDNGEDTNIIISTGTDVTAERTWRFNFGDANRTLTMTGDASLNQSVLTTSTPTFAGITTTGAIATSSGNLTLSPASGAVYGVKTKTLTESSATAFVQIGMSGLTTAGGYIAYTIIASDSTDHQSRSGVLPFAIVNKASTETCTVGTVGAATEVVAVSAGTLTNTFTCDTTPADAVDLAANAVSSLTQTTLQITYTVYLTGAAGNTVTPQ